VQATAILLAEDKIDPISIEEVFPDDDSSSFRGTYVIKLFCRCELMDVVVALQKVEEIRSVYPSPLRSAF
jgi:hypothetical protein